MAIIVGLITKGFGAATMTTAKQRPFFKVLGLPKIEEMWDGTLNVNIAPKKFKVIAYDYFFKNVQWEKGVTEDFGFIEIDGVEFEGKTYDKPGYIYVPHASPHFLNQHLVEIISVLIPGIHTGSKVQISVAGGKIKILE